MATLTATLPRMRRSKKSARTNSNQMTFPEFYYVKHIDNSRLKREVDPVRRRECYGLLGLGVLGAITFRRFEIIEITGRGTFTRRWRNWRGSERCSTDPSRPRLQANCWRRSLRTS